MANPFDGYYGVNGEDDPYAALYGVQGDPDPGSDPAPAPAPNPGGPGTQFGDGGFKKDDVGMLGGTGGGGDDGGGNFWGDIGGMAGSPSYSFKPVPKFNFERYKPVTLQEAQDEPGYQFSEDRMKKALQNNAAARGSLKTGGFLSGLTEQIGQFAQQNFGNVTNRRLAEYDRYYQGAKDSFAPQLAEWQMLSNAEQRKQDLGFSQLWDNYWKTHVSADTIYSVGAE